MVKLPKPKNVAVMHSKNNPTMLGVILMLVGADKPTQKVYATKPYALSNNMSKMPLHSSQ